MNSLRTSFRKYQRHVLNLEVNEGVKSYDKNLIVKTRCFDNDLFKRAFIDNYAQWQGLPIYLSLFNLGRNFKKQIWYMYRSLLMNITYSRLDKDAIFHFDVGFMKNRVSLLAGVFIRDLVMKDRRLYYTRSYMYNISGSATPFNSLVEYDCYYLWFNNYFRKYNKTINLKHIEKNFKISYYMHSELYTIPSVVGLQDGFLATTIFTNSYFLGKGTRFLWPKLFFRWSDKQNFVYYRWTYLLRSRFSMKMIGHVQIGFKGLVSILLFMWVCYLNLNPYIANVLNSAVPKKMLLLLFRKKFINLFKVDVKTFGISSKYGLTSINHILFVFYRNIGLRNINKLKVIKFLLYLFSLNRSIVLLLKTFMRFFIFNINYVIFIGKYAYYKLYHYIYMYKRLFLSIKRGRSAFSRGYKLKGRKFFKHSFIKCKKPLKKKGTIFKG